MQNNEWSLIGFTLLSQASIGAIIYHFIFTFTNSEYANGFSAGRLFGAAEHTILVVLFATLILSFFHLGNPLNAINALNNISTSWLSREILAVSLFMFFVFATALVGAITPNKKLLINILLISSVVIALFLLLAMIKLYMLPTIPAWSKSFTAVGFSLTTLATGAILFLYIAKSSGSISTDSMNRIQHIVYISILILLLFTFINQWMLQSDLAKMTFTGTEQLSFTNGHLYKIHTVRLSLISIAFFTILLSVILSGNFQQLVFLLIFLLIVGEEIAGRFFFYASYFRLGV